MPVKGIDHWVMVVGDVETTLAFYQRLGFTIAWEPRPGRADMPTIRIGEAQKINVHARDWPDRLGYLGARQPSVGGADFCLEWDGTVQEVLDLLARVGIKPEAGPGTRSCARGPSTSVYFRDPDDNLVELTVYPHA
ncbi:MAG: VOC family protein [Candidatus Rokubacteria bacterium]|nr:VOC family protein [Candidatus Rokubacteria bacterium]